jgi:hypothetical protein
MHDVCRREKCIEEVHVSSSFFFFYLARCSFRLFPNFRWDALWGIYSDVTLPNLTLNYLSNHEPVQVNPATLLVGSGLYCLHHLFSSLEHMHGWRLANSVQASALYCLLELWTSTGASWGFSLQFLTQADLNQRGSLLWPNKYTLYITQRKMTTAAKVWVWVLLHNSSAEQAFSWVSAMRGVANN